MSITVANVTTDVTNLYGFQEMRWSLTQYLQGLWPFYMLPAIATIFLQKYQIDRKFLHLNQ